MGEPNAGSRGVALTERLRASSPAPGTPTVTLTCCERRALLLVVGDLDRFSLRPLQSRLDEAMRLGARQLVVDLSPATSIDSAGLLLLAVAAHRLAPDGGVTLVGVTAVHRRLLDVLELGGRFTIA